MIFLMDYSSFCMHHDIYGLNARKAYSKSIYLELCHILQRKKLLWEEIAVGINCSNINLVTCNIVL